MNITKTKIEDLFIIVPEIHSDNRGYFIESFNSINFKNIFSEINFIQDNESKSQYGVLRGLHYQNYPYDQTKLVRVSYGEVLDVALDLRKNSKTFGEYCSVILSSKNKKQFLIPKGFAHGYVVLSDYAIFQYKVDNIYNPEYEGGIIFNDPELNIDWKINHNDLIISEKDLKFKTIIDLKNEKKL
tara:strand:- start:20144 stop:20698 length:555 start_codon:yes stop_codon:yes gene_type:complete